MTQDREDGALVRLPQDYIITEGQKAIEAHKLRLNGHSWRDIAEAVGYSSPGDAEVEVRRMLRLAAKAYDTEQKREIVDLEMERLDALQVAVWPAAMMGDTKAVDSCVKIINTRLKHMVPEGETGNGATRQTLIISRDDFIQSMKEIAGE